MEGRGSDRIRRADLTIVICGEYTDTAEGVAAELTIAQEEENPIFCCGDVLTKPVKSPPWPKIQTISTDGNGVF